MNRLTLKIQYRLADHIFVHTDKMKQDLIAGYGVRAEAVSVIPFGINNSVPDTDLTPAMAKERLGLPRTKRRSCFLAPYAPTRASSTW